MVGFDVAERSRDQQARDQQARDQQEGVSPTCVVVAPSCFLTVTIESDDQLQRVHLHPGGQGFWIGRMASVLGVGSRLVAPVGGEAGEVLGQLMTTWGVDLRGVPVPAPTPTQVHDRSTGDRVELVGITEPALDRHSHDDFYGSVLEEALGADGVVLTAPSSSAAFPDASYGRLVSDLGSRPLHLFGDLHGAALYAALTQAVRRQAFDVLKVSEDDLRLDGWTMNSERDAVTAARTLQGQAGGAVVISRAWHPAIVCDGDRVVRVVPPELAVADHRGAGDSMTGAIVAGRLHGLDRLDAIRLGAAAGAGNVTRHGLGTGHPGLIRELLDLVELEDLR